MKIHPDGRRLGRAYGVKKSIRTLQLSKYIEKLPAPPPSIDHASKLTADLGMMLNDQLGICVPAAAGHMRMAWEANAGEAQTRPTDAQLRAAYFAVSGGQDTGLYPLDWLNYWRKTGLAGDKIEGFVATDGGNLTQAKLAIQIFGSHFTGMSLPDVNTFGPWLTPTGAPDPNNGHMVCLVAYDDARQVFQAISWGEFMEMSYSWFQRYVDEGYAVLNDIELITASGLTPEGFNMDQLVMDIDQIGDPVTPVIPPDPTPPAPDPVSPMCRLAAVARRMGFPV